MKKCELCQQPARTYCESDEAFLCWACDSKVHGANFLVARHSRTLLCHACHAPTAWKASGGKIPHAFSVCRRCMAAAADDDDSRNDDTDQDSDNEEDDDDVSDCDEEGDEEAISTPPPPPSTASSSSSEGGANNDSRYRRRVSVDNASDLRAQQDDLRRLAVRLRCETDCADTDGDGGADSVECARALKHRRLDLNRSIPQNSRDTESPGKLAVNSVTPSILSLVSDTSNEGA